MSLDATARESNVRDSLKKYFTDSLKSSEKIPITFDTSLSVPKLQGKDVDRWVSIRIGPMKRVTLSEVIVSFYCCTRKDNEGFRLAQLGDTVMGCLTPDSDDEDNTDGIKRICLYRSASGGYTNWEEVGSLLVTNIDESSEMITTDKTKYKILTVTVNWIAKV